MFSYMLQADNLWPHLDCINSHFSANKISDNIAEIVVIINYGRDRKKKLNNTEEGEWDLDSTKYIKLLLKITFPLTFYKYLLFS